MVLCIPFFFLAFSTTQEAKVLRGKIAYVQVREGCSKEVASALDVDVVKVTFKKKIFGCSGSSLLHTDFL